MAPHKKSSCWWIPQIWAQKFIVVCSLDAGDAPITTNNNVGCNVLSSGIRAYFTL
ncbi:hypothetical protein [Erwinia tasmaniensis]|uniref:hypothetical protein n=1 Tax=Erwinia tasmaniensis TaxID=338565 RepID=UPI0002D4ADAD|nr:hypothetical protein [Erwinia tasmaniensis]